MKRVILLAFFACLAFCGCGKNENPDLPQPLAELKFTRWESSLLSMTDDAFLSISSNSATYRTENNNSVPYSRYFGEGNISSMNENTIIFSDFIATRYQNMSAVKIERAEYSFQNDYLHKLTIYYREGTKEMVYPLPTDWIWNEIETRDFNLYN